MGFIEKRSGGYRARYRDPLGRLTSKTFTRKADAERWTKEMEVAIERGDWLDPPSAQVPLATWAEEYLSLARRLSPSTQETYERDLRKYILPRFGAYRIGRLPADEIENWLNDEVAARRRPVVCPPPLPPPAPDAAGRRPEAEAPRQPVRPGRAAARPQDGDDVPHVGAGGRAGRGAPGALPAMIYLAVDSGMRLERAHRPPPGTRGPRPAQGPGDGTDDPTEGRQLAPQGTEDAGVGPLHHHVGRDR